MCVFVGLTFPILLSTSVYYVTTFYTLKIYLSKQYCRLVFETLLGENDFTSNFACVDKILKRDQFFGVCGMK